METTDYTMIYRIARSYYLDGLSQQAISVREHMSRPHVSRMLAKARELGIVNIEVTMPPALKLPELQERVREALGLAEVVLAHIPDGGRASQSDVSLDIATAAADHLPAMLDGASTVGIGWGYTLYQTSLLLAHTASEGMTFVPLIGMSGQDNPFLQVNVIVNRFAEKFGAPSYYTAMPAIRSVTTRLALIEQQRNDRLTALWRDLDVAVVGLGVPVQEGEAPLAEASGEYSRLIARSHLAGDILAHYFDADGKVFDSSAYYQHFSMPLESLRRVRRVICVAGGRRKVDGIIAAARCGYIHTLITDTNTARELLARARSEELTA